MQQPILELQNLGMRFGGLELFSGINISVSKGEILVLMDQEKPHCLILYAGSINQRKVRLSIMEKILPACRHIRSQDRE